MYKCMQVAKRGFWRHLCVREGRRKTFFPSQAASEATQTNCHSSLADLDTDSFLIPAVSCPVEHAHTKGIQLDPKALAQIPPDEPKAPYPENVVLLLQVNPEYSNRQAVKAELEAFVAYLRLHKPPELPGPSVCVIQEHALCGNGAPPDAKMYPAPGFETSGSQFSDAICNLTFTLKPTSFFQACANLRLIGFRLWPHASACWLQQSSMDGQDSMPVMDASTRNGNVSLLV
jgi:hypothetical protein